MATINRYSQSKEADYRPSVLPLPYEALLRQGIVKQQAYDTNLANIDTAENFLKTQALEQDAAERNQIVQGYHDEIRQAVENVGGDYGKLDGFVPELSRRIKTDLNYGKLGAFQKNYDTVIKAKTDLDKRRSEGKISDSGYKLALNSIANFEGTKQLEDGVFTQIQPYNPVSSYQVAEKALDFASKIKETDIGNMGISSALKGQYNLFAQKKGIEFKPAQMATAHWLLNNQEALSNIQEELQANGIPVTRETVQERAFEYAAAPAAAMAHTTSSFQIRDDEDYKLAAKKKMEELSDPTIHTTLPTLNPTYNNSKPDTEFYMRNGKLKINKNKYQDMLNTMASSYGATGNLQAMLGAKVGAFIARWVTPNDEVDEKSPDYKRLLDYAKTIESSTGQPIFNGKSFENATPEDINLGVAKIFNQRIKQSVSSPFSLNKSSKFKENFDKVFFSSDKGTTINTGAANLFKFYDDKGKVVDLKQFAKEGAQISYAGSIDDFTSPYEYGSSVVFVEGKQLIMSPTEDDKGDNNYLINRILSSNNSPTFSNDFTFKGEKHSTIYNPKTDTYSVEDQNGDYTGDYRLGENEEGKAALIPIE